MTISTEPDLTVVPLLQDDPADQFRPVEDYAAQTLPNAFIELEATLRPLLRQHRGVTAFDTTVFYSRRRQGLTDQAEIDLAEQNRAAFAGALKRGGLVVYFQGHLLTDPDKAQRDPALTVDFNPDCLSFCIWESRQQAIAGADLDAHRKAASQVAQWYSNFAIRKYTLQVDASGDIQFEAYNGSARNHK